MGITTLREEMAESLAGMTTEDRLTRLERENLELRAVLEATLGVQGELSLDAMLQKVVEHATELLGAEYGALSVVGDDDQIEQFVTCGVDNEKRLRIGAPPRGVGLLGVPLLEDQALRLADIASDPRAAGFPAGHPEMMSLLAVPIICRGPHRGNLYLANKRSEEAFNDDDQRTLQRFARGAAVAIDTVDLHQRSESLAIAEERLRISREIHDGLAQVLAYVNTKAQAARELVSRRKAEDAIHQLDELAAAARGVYSEVRESILALRLQPSAEQPLAETVVDYVEHWQRRGTTVAKVDIKGDLRLSSEVQLQVVRIVQEALANVRKHSRARHVEICLERSRTELLVSVADDGCGFDPELSADEGGRRFGLSVMRERAEGIGGRFSLETGPGAGTRISVALPLGTRLPDWTGGTRHANPDS